MSSSLLALPPLPPGSRIIGGPGASLPPLPPGSRVLSGPGAQAQQQPKAAVATQPGALSRFLRGALAGATGIESWGDVRRGFTEGLPFMAEHPIESAKLLGGAEIEGQRQQFREAKEALHAPIPGAARLSEAAGHALAGALPIIGPAAGAAADALGGPDRAAGLGQAAGLVGSVAFDPEGNLARAGSRAVEAARPVARLAEYLRARTIPPLGEAAMRGEPTSAELIEHAQEEGIPATAAQLTGSKPLKLLQKTGEGSVLASGLLAKRMGRVAEAMEDAYRGYLDRLAPEGSEQALRGSEGPAEAGAMVQAALTAGRDATKKEISQGFDALDKDVGSGAVDTNGASAAAQAIEKEMGSYYREHPQALDGVRTAWKWVTDLASYDRERPAPKPSFLDREAGYTPPAPTPRGPMTFREAQNVRSDLLAALDDPRVSPGVRDRAEGWIARLVGAVDDSMIEGAARLDPAAQGRFRFLNARWKGLKSDFNDPRSPLYQALAARDPKSLTQMLTGPAQGGSLRTVDLLRRYLPKEAWPVLQRDFVRALGDSGNGTWSAGDFVRNAQRYSPEYLRALLGDSGAQLVRAAARRSLGRLLVDRNENGTVNWRTFAGNLGRHSSEDLQGLGFSPGEIGWLRRHAALARRINEDINPSGTGPARQAQRELTGLAASVPTLALGSVAGHPAVAAGAAAAELAPAASGALAARLATSRALEEWATRTGMKPPPFLAQWLTRPRSFGRLSRYLRGTAGAAAAGEGAAPGAAQPPQQP